MVSYCWRRLSAENKISTREGQTPIGSADCANWRQTLGVLSLDLRQIIVCRGLFRGPMGRSASAG